MSLKELVKNTPVLGSLARCIRHKLVLGKRRTDGFSGSADYWEKRYASKGNSGSGSYGELAEFKAEILNRFVADNSIQSVIEFGCGDGNQLTLARYPKYIGYDVSPTVLAQCRRKFSADNSKKFFLVSEYSGEKADLSLSLDVIYHLVEDDVFEKYMYMLFGSSNKFVIIYSSDFDDNCGFGPHIKHRKVNDWIKSNIEEWTLKEHIPNRFPYVGDGTNGSFADFYIYAKRTI